MCVKAGEQCSPLRRERVVRGAGVRGGGAEFCSYGGRLCGKAGEQCSPLRRERCVGKRANNVRPYEGGVCGETVGQVCGRRGDMGIGPYKGVEWASVCEGVGFRGEILDACGEIGWSRGKCREREIITYTRRRRLPNSRRGCSNFYTWRRRSRRSTRWNTS